MNLIPVEYRISEASPTHGLFRHFSLVIRRVYDDDAYTDQWYVTDGFESGPRLSKQGEWIYPHGYSKEVWTSLVRCDTVEEAQQVAEAHLATMTVNGMTLQDALAKGYER